MNKEDFSYHVNARGYMVKYKGKNVGGAGIIGEYTGKGRQRWKQIESYRQTCKREIDAILAGHGQARFLQVIRDIDEGKYD